MDLGIAGKRALITGASSNIGRATAAVFGGEGARVAVGYHSNEAGAKETARLVERAGGESMIVQLDLANEASIGSAARQAGEMWGGIDILVNNAVAWTAHPAQGELFETTPAGRMREGLDANLLGPYLLARAVVGDMRARGWGRVVHISTGLVADGRAGSATYVTPKAGLHGLTRTMSRELAGSGILTNLVMAGFVVGDKAVPAAVVDACAAAAATGRTTAAEEVGRVVAFLCSAANGHVTGELIRADGHFLTPA